MPLDSIVKGYLNMFKARNILIGLACLLINPMILAATATGNLSVTANVPDTCTVGAGTNLLPFGTYTGTVLDVNGLLQVTCTAGDSYSIALDAGSAPGATFSSRTLTNLTPPGTLNYTIFTDPTRTTVWGDGTMGTGTVAETGTGAAQSITVPGTIFGGQSAGVTPGSYVDTVNITVTF
jgi:spore coat protein U-like protein